MCTLVLCEYFSKQRHGFDKKWSDKALIGHILCLEKGLEHKLNDLSLKPYLDLRAVDFHGGIVHDFIKNYEMIISSNVYTQPQIAQVIYLDKGECVCILKTFWLKCVQRCWRRELVSGTKCLKGMFWRGNKCSPRSQLK